jgi:STAS domain
VDPDVTRCRLRIGWAEDGTLHLTGEIDAATARLMRAALETPAGEPGARQVVDLRGVVYLGSAGLSVLHDHAHRLHLIIRAGSAPATGTRVTGLGRGALVSLRD